MTDKNLADSWILHAQSSWAWDMLHDIVSESHDKAWPIVFEIARKTDSDEV